MARKLHLNVVNHKAAPGWDPDTALSEALAEKASFLQKYPQYKAYQAEIDSMLDKAGSSQNRMAVLAMLIEGKLIELNEKLKDLHSFLMEMPRQ